MEGILRSEAANVGSERRMVGGAGNAPVRRFRLCFATPDLQSGSRIASPRACLKIVGGRRVRARGLREMAKILKPCRPGPLSGRVFKHALKLVAGVGVAPT